MSPGASTNISLVSANSQTSSADVFNIEFILRE